uniref:Endonuclease/exonuclease/phosphatase domain-containing protein n=1 Tax=Chromera velia CCMP2878 TaxID=1169474 RepID=A0A0G4FZ85_9ALVE|eukprot:Cvel_19507.t1-p1 / transcript=Cvel_19507.t1 / gene=Cvel_19507 / organism=Chromera_velia_CCMP2878 / gene_product=hypothetical protein / transcript_product=hypothetical protein / location=Cvel_scaffold1687:32711-36143(+) / protein_length=525 / sequence_SO=supercontig / SO=protein_coding / is_pseudo=false
MTSPRLRSTQTLPLLFALGFVVLSGNCTRLRKGPKGPKVEEGGEGKSPLRIVQWNVLEQGLASAAIPFVMDRETQEAFMDLERDGEKKGVLEPGTWEAAKKDYFTNWHDLFPRYAYMCWRLKSGLPPKPRIRSCVGMGQEVENPHLKTLPEVLLEHKRKGVAIGEAREKILETLRTSRQKDRYVFAWQFRGPALQRKLAESAADLIFLNEYDIDSLPVWTDVDGTMKALPFYQSLRGLQRVFFSSPDKAKGGGSAIFFKSARFEVLPLPVLQAEETDEFLQAPPPVGCPESVPVCAANFDFNESAYRDNICARKNAGFLLLRDRMSGKLLLLTVTHLITNSKDKNARKKLEEITVLDLLIRRFRDQITVERGEEPLVVAAGDFNSDLSHNERLFGELREETPSLGLSDQEGVVLGHILEGIATGHFELGGQPFYDPFRNARLDSKTPFLSSISGARGVRIDFILLPPQLKMQPDGTALTVKNAEEIKKAGQDMPFKVKKGLSESPMSNAWVEPSDHVMMEVNVLL